MRDNWFSTVIICVLLTGLGYCIYQIQHLPSAEITTVNVGELTESHVRKLAEENLSGAELDKKSQQLVDEIESIIKAVAEADNLVIIAVQNPIHGARDITPIIGRLLRTRLGN